jgi:hypothetical protein
VAYITARPLESQWMGFYLFWLEASRPKLRETKPCGEETVKLYTVSEDGRFVKYAERDFAEEHLEETLETWLESNPDCILQDERVMLLGRQVSTNLDSTIDLLAVDRDGNVVVIELKRGRTPRDTIAQLLEYASFAASLTFEELEALHEEYRPGENPELADYHREYFGLGDAEGVAFNKMQNLVIIAQSVSKQVRQTSLFLRERGLDVRCLEFKYFETSSGERIVSTDVVVGPEDVPMDGTNKEKFLRSLDAYGRPFFTCLLKFAEAHGLPVHWGKISLSLRAVTEDREVTFLLGYPTGVEGGQSVYTAAYEIEAKVRDGKDIADDYLAAVSEIEGFRPAGKSLKLAIDHLISEDQTEQLLKILSSVAERVSQRGLPH